MGHPLIRVAHSRDVARWISLMKGRRPLVTLWMLKQGNCDVSDTALQNSFGLRFLLSSLDFLLTWGVLTMVAWSTVAADADGWQRRVVCCVVASFLYGLLNAARDIEKR